MALSGGLNMGAMVPRRPAGTGLFFNLPYEFMLLVSIFDTVSMPSTQRQQRRRKGRTSPALLYASEELRSDHPTMHQAGRHAMSGAAVVVAFFSDGRAKARW